MYTVQQRLLRAAGSCAGLALLAVNTGCEVNSFFDPSKTGSFNTTPSTIPILTRIDVIERDTDEWRNAAPPTPEDLLPNDVQYRLAPGDVVRVDIFELLRTNEMTSSTRIIDQAGFIRLPTLGDVPAAGLTLQELQDEITHRLRGLITNPNVSVGLEQGRSLQFTITGGIEGVGVYTLSRPDLRIADALALAGGAPETTERVFVIRRTPLEESVLRQDPQPISGQPQPTPPPSQQPIDIESLIDQLPGASGNGSTAPNGGNGAVRPGAFAQDGAPTVDIDDLEPVRVSDRVPTRPARTSPQPAAAPAPPIRQIPGATSPRGGDAFIFDMATNQWVRVPAADRGKPLSQEEQAVQLAEPLFAGRIIEIPYRPLMRGDASLNIVIRPNDTIYVQPPDFGVVYIDGEVLRPGVYSLPTGGGLTLSRLISAAGGLGPIAIPERVDLTRMIADAREATVRVNLAAIRRRTEPDFYLKPNDSIIVGTNWFAQPLAVIRNGFRMTYGFGFLLDRNFGNDVFGAPPTNVVGQ